MCASVAHGIAPQVDFLQVSLPVAPARAAAPAVKPVAPVAPADPEPLKEGTAFYDSLAAEVPEDDVVLEKNLMVMVNKLMRKDKDNTFKVEPQKGPLSSRIVRSPVCTVPQLQCQRAARCSYETSRLVAPVSYSSVCCSAEECVQSSHQTSDGADHHQGGCEAASGSQDSYVAPDVARSRPDGGELCEI